MAASTPRPPALARSSSPTTTTAITTTIAAPASPMDMLSPSISNSISNSLENSVSNSPASPSALRLSPAGDSGALSVPASPSATTTTTTTTTTNTSPPAAAATSSNNTSVAMGTNLGSSTPAANSSSNTTPPTKKVLERNQACLGCRQRKRKCDGGKPNCGACERLERQCVYTHNAVTKIHSSSHYREHSSRPSAAARASASNDSASVAATAAAAARGNSSTPSLVAPAANRHSSNSVSGGSAAGFTAVNAEGTAGPLSARPSPPAVSRLSPHLTSGSSTVNTRKRSFSSLNSSPAASTRNVKRSSSSSSSSHIHNLEHDYVHFSLQFLQASPYFDSEFIDASPAEETSVFRDALPELTDEGLPSPKVIVELFHLFFEKWHSMLPCLYKKQVLADILPGRPLSEPNTLTFAILALAGYLHPDPGMKAVSDHWASLGKDCFNRTVQEGRFTMQAVQGGIYLCLRMFGMAQMSQMWIFLGSVWRMCLPLGFHQIDSNSSMSSKGFVPEPRSELEIEERRRTVWAVYILDRLTSISVPWTMCVVDSEFCVNFPASEEVFQNGSMQNVEHMVIDPFPTTLDSLHPPTAASADAYQHLCKLAVLLGRILSYTRSSTYSPGSFESLDTALTGFLLKIPKPYRSMVGIVPSELPTVLLLGCTMHACTIFLHGDGDEEGEGAGRSFQAVDNILSLVRNVSSSLGPDDDRVFGNPLLGPILFLGARILCARFQAEGSRASSLGKIELLLGVFGRMDEGWPKLAGLVRNIVTEDLKRDPMDMRG